MRRHDRIDVYVCCCCLLSTGCRQLTDGEELGAGVASDAAAERSQRLRAQPSLDARYRAKRTAGRTAAAAGRGARTADITAARRTAREIVDGDDDEQ